MTGFALVIWVYQGSGSALTTALLTICSYAPYILLSIYEPLKYDYKRGFISVPLWDAEFLKHLDSGLILDFRYLQTITVYDDFIRLCREIEEFEPGDDSDGIVVYPEQRL